MKVAQSLLDRRWALPVLIIAVVDLVVRWRKLLEWNRWEILFYALSVVFALACVRVVAGLLPDRRKYPRFYWPLVTVLGTLSGFILLAHFDYYFYFGVHPEIIGLGHLIGEPTEALSVMRDEISPLHIVAFALLMAVGAFTWRISTEPPPRRFGFWGATVLVVLLIPAFNQNVAMSPGNFMPSVNLVFTATKAIQYAAQGKGSFRRMQVSSRVLVPPQSAKLPYNVLILVNESLRARETGFNGYGRDTTPNVDAFLKTHPQNTFNFTKCFTNSTKTSESVPSILTGVHPIEDYRKLHRYPLFYEYVKAFPETRSFLYAAHGYNVANFRFFLRTPRLDDLVYQEVSGHPRFNSLGMDDKFLVPPFQKTIVGLPAAARFVGILHMNGPHYPYQVPDEELKWGKGSRQDQYDNSIRYQDKTIGAFLRVLQESGRLDSTIIFSTSDHGEAFGEHGVNGHRRTFYEEIIHVPCWIHLPAALAKVHGTTLRANQNLNMTNLDWVPTLVDLLGLGKVESVAELMADIDGRSLVRPLDPERPILVQNGDSNQRLSDGFALVKGPWRLLDHPRGAEGHIELYNLAQDPDSRDDRWSTASPGEREKWRDAVAEFPQLSRRVTSLLSADRVGPNRASK